MGLFDAFKKKECSICGGEIGLLGNRKLEDGNCCKACAGKLSPWFDDRRHSTIAQIEQQLAYREENRNALDGFHPTLTFGDYYTLEAELQNGVPDRFVVTRSDDWKEANADLIRFTDVTSFEIDVQEHNRELKYRNSKGEDVSYNPPRYEYSYNFYAEIHVNHPYFDDLRFQLNRNTIELETVGRPGLLRSGFDPSHYPEYRQFRSHCDELEALFRAGMQGAVLPGHAPVQPELISDLLGQLRSAPDMDTAARLQREIAALAANASDRDDIVRQSAEALSAARIRIARAAAGAPAAAPQTAPAGPKFCPNCGAPADGGKFCQSCGSRLA